MEKSLQKSECIEHAINVSEGKCLCSWELGGRGPVPGLPKSFAVFFPNLTSVTVAAIGEARLAISTNQRHYLSEKGEKENFSATPIAVNPPILFLSFFKLSYIFFFINRVFSLWLYQDGSLV